MICDKELIANAEIDVHGQIVMCGRKFTLLKLILK